MYYALLFRTPEKEGHVPVWAGDVVAPAIQFGFEPIMCEAIRTFGLDLNHPENSKQHQPRLCTRAGLGCAT